MSNETATPLSQGTIEKLADEFTAIYSRPPIPICEIARELGMKVYETDFGKHRDNLSGFCDLEKGDIYVNNDELRLRQVFTIAHEIGHYVLHRKQIDRKHTVLPRRKSAFHDSPIEKEADMFAIALLMPRHLINRYQPAAHVSLLAKVFNVERTMMERRLRSV